MRFAFNEDEAAILRGWADVLDGLRWSARDTADASPEPVERSVADQLRQGGWIDLPRQPEITTVVSAEAIRLAHHRINPLPVALLDWWVAQQIDASAGDGVLTISSDDVMHPHAGGPPGKTGWVALGGADFLLTLAAAGKGAAVYAVEATRATPCPATSLDQALEYSSVEVDAAQWREIGSLSATALDHLQSIVLAYQSAALVGQAAALLEGTIEYMQIREQFGVPIGSFQALKHRAANLYADLHVAEVLARYAAWAVDNTRAAFQIACLSKTYCADVCIRIGSDSLQLHGGLGFTWDAGLHRGLRRIGHLAITGMSAQECAVAAGRLALDSTKLVWAGQSAQSRS